MEARRDAPGVLKACGAQDFLSFGIFITVVDPCFPTQPDDLDRPHGMEEYKKTLCRRCDFRNRINSFRLERHQKGQLGMLHRARHAPARRENQADRKEGSVHLLGIKWKSVRWSFPGSRGGRRHEPTGHHPLTTSPGNLLPCWTPRC